MISGFGGSKSRLAKAAGAEPAGQTRDEKLHAVVARSTCRSENVQSTPFWEHFWQLRCRKSARRCRAKHISKSKCTKHTSFGPLLEVEMSKKCTPLWREAHFQVKMYKTHQLRTTFGSWDVEKVHAVVARSTFRSENVQNTRGSDHFWRFRCRFASLHYTTLHYTSLHYRTLHYTTLHYTTFHYTSLHSTTLHSTTLQLHNYTKLHYNTLHYTTLHYTTLHYTQWHCTADRWRRDTEREREREIVREINHLSLHQWLRSAVPDSQQATSPIGFLYLKLPPPPCAVLLVM